MASLLRLLGRRVVFRQYLHPSLFAREPSHFSDCFKERKTTLYRYSISSGAEGSVDKDGSYKMPRQAKAPKEVSYRIRQLCKDGGVDTAKKLLYRTINDAITYEPTNMFNCIMYWCLNLGRFEDVRELLSVMETRKYAFDEGTLSVMVQLYARTECLEKGIELLKKIECSKHFRLRPKMYTPLIVAAANMGDLETAFSLREDMKEKTVEEYPTDELYEGLVRGCALSGEKKWYDKAESILLDFRRDRLRIPPETLQSVKEFFASRQDMKWCAEMTSVSTMGRCQGCGQHLGSGQLSCSEHATLKNYLASILWQFVSSLPNKQVTCFTSIGNYVDHFVSRATQPLPQSLKHFIAVTGPYDIVLDALNIGYKPNHRPMFCTDKVQRVVTHFLQGNKRVMVVGSNPLSFEEWRKKPERPVGSLVEFIIQQQHCGLFLVSDRKLDDYYSLCAAMHCGPGTQLVSSDKFSDHTSSIEPNMRALFGRWQRLAQLFVAEGKQLEVRKELPVDPIVQVTPDSWHFPSERPGQWLCVTRTN